MTGPDLIRLAEELARCGGVHRLTNLVTAAVHVTLEHGRRHRTVEAWEDGPHGVGMSDKSVRVNLDAVARFEAARAAPIRPPEREEPSGRCVEAQDGRGGSTGPETTLGWICHNSTLSPVKMSGEQFDEALDRSKAVFDAAFPPQPVTDTLRKTASDYLAAKASGRIVDTTNPAPVMPERGEHVPLPSLTDPRWHLRTGNALAEERGVTHASDSPVLTGAQSDFGRRLVPRHMPPVNPELDGDGA